MNKNIEAILIQEKSTIKEAMEHINEGGMGIVLVVDKNRKLLGVATDGDIRRALLSGKDFSSPIRNIMVDSPVTAKEGTAATRLLEIMLDKGIQEIPITNNDGIVVDIALLPELRTISLSSPDITHKEVEIINQILSTPFLSIGPKVKEFEKKMADYIGVNHAVAVNSGTSGLHLCIKSLGIKDGDEVITTPFSFIASSNCALFERANPVFVDINEHTLCIDPSKIEEKITERTKAILPVHIFGHACDMDKIIEISKSYNLAIIEDSCEAIGAEFKGKRVGSFGDAGVFAFYPNKQITTAEGGMIVTDDQNIAELCRSMRNQGRTEGEAWLSHKMLGFNYRLSELSAGLGVAQLDRISEILEKRQRVAQLYIERLSAIDGTRIPYISPNVKMSWFVFVIRLDYKRFSREARDEIIYELKRRGVSCSNYFPPIHLEPFYVEMYGFKKGDFPTTERVSESTIALPFYNNLPETEIDYICDTLKKILSEKVQ
jgi:perosamine synthetase